MVVGFMFLEKGKTNAFFNWYYLLTFEANNLLVLNRRSRILID